MRRRSLLIGVGAASVAAIPQFMTPQSMPLIRASLDQATPDVSPIDISQARRQISSTNLAFRNARYAELLHSIPTLLNRLHVTYETVTTAVARNEASQSLAELYTVLSALMVKVNDNSLAEQAANHASHYAQPDLCPLTYALAHRARAITLRRNGNNQEAQQLLVDTAARMSTYRFSDDRSTVYGLSLATAAYTAAVGGHRNTMQDLLHEANNSVSHLTADRVYRHVTFGPTTSEVFGVSAFQALGEGTNALEYARRVDTTAILEPERLAQFWVYVAKAFHQDGDFSRCFQALMKAESAAPEEIRYRKPIKDMTATLLETASRNSLPEVRRFARRTGLMQKQPI